MILALTALLAALGAAETQERSRGRLRQLGNRLGTSVTPISFMRRRLDAILRERPEARPWLDRAYGMAYLRWDGSSDFDREDRWRPSDGLVLDWISRVAEYPDVDTQLSIEAFSTAGALEEDWIEEMDVEEAMEYLLSAARVELRDENGEDWDLPRATLESVPLVGEDGTTTWHLAYTQLMTPGVSLAFGLDMDNWILVRLGQAHLSAPGEGTWWTPERRRATEIRAAENVAEWPPFFAAVAKALHLDGWKGLGWGSLSPVSRPVKQPGGWLLQFDHLLTDGFLRVLETDARTMAEKEPTDLSPTLEALPEADPKWSEHLEAFASEIEEHRVLRSQSPEESLGKLFWLRQEVQDHVRAYGDEILRSTSLEAAADTLLRETISALIAERDKAIEALGEGDEVVRVRWPDGGTIVELLTPAALAMEGARMHHCIGREQQGHPAALRRGETRVFSVRLPNGSPRGTLEVDRSNGAQRDLGGPYNGQITPDLLRDRLAWFHFDFLSREHPNGAFMTRAVRAMCEETWDSVEAGGVGAQLVPSEEGR